MTSHDPDPWILTSWEKSLAPQIAEIIAPRTFMMIVGVTEIAAGLLVALKPKIGGLVVAAWLAGIIINLLLVGGYLDIALRDLGLLLGALALSRLAVVHEKRRLVT